MTTSSARVRKAPPPVAAVPLALQRKCACGAPASSLDLCPACVGARGGLQRKLALGAADDPLEREADRVAERITAVPDPAAAAAAPVPVRRFAPAAPSAAPEAPASVTRALASPGRPLEPRTRHDMERRFGRDFSHVRIHDGATADRSARAVEAQAFTVGGDIVFGAGRFAPDTSAGRRLLAHELAHTLQQGAGGRLVQRGTGELRLSEACEEIKTRIRATPAYAALPADAKKRAEDIMAELDKREVAERFQLLTKLELLFTVVPKPPATVTAETNTQTTKEVTKEKARLSQPAEAQKTGTEEAAVSATGAPRIWTRVPGKFGGGAYYVDNRSPTDIHIKAAVHLVPAGTGTQAVVDQIVLMEDAIEKAASTEGYVVDIEFVPAKTADSFEVKVDPSQWETATNWSGGAPKGFAHELHHLFKFELDKYDYIKAHAGNTSMKIEDRLFWFQKELSKPANYNDPTSIMGSAAHPNDRDVCETAGLDMKTCLEARAKARAKSSGR
ncbi:MAG TPA: DUF4157 domain-containing protein [Allosphingosinicella sp.]|nr:DUF4157 domain-containing protein [Allosphingosinicella sp.]